MRTFFRLAFLLATTAGLAGPAYLACSADNLDSPRLVEAGTSTSDGAVTTTPASDGAVDATPPPVPSPCPTSDAGAFTAAGATCFAFTPIDTGEPATGQNANEPHYAVRPSTGTVTSLVLFFIGSGGNPSGATRAGPDKNVYSAAVSTGKAVLAISYANDVSVGKLCQHDDACFFPTRQSIILGGAIPDGGVTADETIVGRAAVALRFLAAGDPAGGWGTFLTSLDPATPPATALAWPKIIAAGHSQGGGHAAAIGKLFPVSRVIQFSSTCDSVDGVAATWTDGTTGTWASDPTLFFGFAAPTTFTGDAPTGGDVTCPYHTRNWTNLGMKANHRNNFAETCGATGDTHGESIKCADNYATWVTLFQ